MPNVLDRALVAFAYGPGKRLHRWLIRRAEARLAKTTELHHALVEGWQRIQPAVREGIPSAVWVSAKTAKMITESRRDLVKQKKRLENMQLLYVKMFVSPGFKGRS